ncbi:nucleotide-binding universal stress UspA family protein [Isoptericola jiangsuensis]|uniref:Nucleotide-binding universal stress UspA family protein n=1 Tax=Isoptericola jiangsuensis TaxID=548579 RepID=A0A2A9EZI5_9MICO|nr:universal stress protein [Isoptericola jiangsuensis]PFG43559.1 nucleotide-binding universal stress UspA family protein [Isoptericola jiangsuensis]
MRHDGPVVIALDGSPHSEQTLEWGLAEAEHRAAEAVLARAFQVPRDPSAWNWYLVVPEPALLAEVKEYLVERLEHATVRSPGIVISTRALDGPEVPALQALTTDAQLLVVGAQGQVGRTRVGRVGAHLAAHSRCPVAVVRGASQGGSVVVGVDGSPTSLAAAAAAAREAVWRGVPLVVLHARPPLLDPHVTVREVPPLATSDADDPTHQAAERTAATLREENPGLEVRLELLDDEPVHALLARSGPDDLVVVGSRGMGAFRGMLLGSVSNEVVRHASGTVLVVHDDEDR